jgi:hypothetical protein
MTTFLPTCIGRTLQAKGYDLPPTFRFVSAQLLASSDEIGSAMVTGGGTTVRSG